ncbi:MAG: peptidylprolyl isomerase [Candidatus Obscuribacterales bacterium]|nr:peptidylprolyl isomerase [Candidatus Obscuribacterales bacterium]
MFQSRRTKFVPFQNLGKRIALLGCLFGVAATFVADSAALAKQYDSNGVLIAAVKKGTMSADPIVIMETSKGTIKIQVHRNDAPITAGNFVDLVQKGFYNGLTFHRYEPGFVIQGGDPKGDGTGGYVDPDTKTERRIPLEVKQTLKHSQAGIVAMARSSDPNSASCQFYITLGPASFLDMQYAVFGKVIDGLPAALELRRGDKIVKAVVQEPAVK